MEKSKIRILKKRTRSANFSEQNKESLFKIITPFINILENKRTDKHTSILKSKTWENIVIQYNLINVPQRTGYQLKAFYEAKKRQFKTNRVKYMKMNADEFEIKTENILSEISSTSTTLVNNNDTNKDIIINDCPQITISNPMIEIPKIGISNSCNSPSPNGNPTVLKCVDIKKLKTLENKIISVQPAVVSSTFDIQQKLYQSPTKINNDSVVSTYSNNLEPNTNINNGTIKNSINSDGNKNSIIPIQEDLNKIRLGILNDERKFRKDEHMKRMEYMELSILVMKSNLSKQYN